MEAIYKCSGQIIKYTMRKWRKIGASLTLFDAECVLYMARRILSFILMSYFPGLKTGSGSDSTDDKSKTPHSNFPPSLSTPSCSAHCMQLIF